MWNMYKVHPSLFINEIYKYNKYKPLVYLKQSVNISLKFYGLRFNL